jgi:UDP-N-acetyl-D-galactosamine dehydrogenase
VHRAPSIKVAEAAKVIENTQRDLNIALMNELSAICHALGIDTGDVLAAANTKWNFLPFFPGLVAADALRPAGAAIFAVAHQAFVRRGWPLVTSLLKKGGGVVLAV